MSLGDGPEPDIVGLARIHEWPATMKAAAENALLLLPAAAAAGRRGRRAWRVGGMAVAGQSVSRRGEPAGERG